MSTADLQSTFRGLEPAVVWNHFATLCATPRMSKHEGPLRAILRAWAEARGLAAEVDGVGNLIIRKPATPGREGSPTVVLQAHLDMVCQKNGESTHDFMKDPIRPVVKDGWVVAEKTTLGADNGMGVSMILALLEDQSLAHGPLEALLTIDEETGMSGAHGLEPGKLRGKLMLNLDTEDWGEFFLGCAGGLDVDARGTPAGEDLPPGFVAARLALRGLRGGHSGVDIHEGRGNAIRALLQVLLAGRGLGLRVASFEGGTARNAIAREASAVVAVPGAQLGALEALVAEQAARLKKDLANVDPGVTVVVERATAQVVLAAADQARWLEALVEAPYGVRRMSAEVPGVVETSNNLGVVKLAPGEAHANFMVRSLKDAEAVALAEDIVKRLGARGLAAQKSGAYPGWAPNPTSPLLAKCQAVYRREFGADSQVKVIHAGLECGLIGAKYPGMDTVSFGPTIRGAHAPGEKVEVASVGRCFRLVREVLASLT